MGGKFFAQLRQQWMGGLALLLVLTGGTAYAADTVFSTDIVDGEVKTPDIASNAVGTGKIGTNQVFPTDVRDDTLPDGGLTAVDLAANSVGTSEVDGSLTGSDIDENAINGDHVADGELRGADVADKTLTSADIAANAVSGAEIANNSATGDDVNESTLGIVPNANTLDGLDSTRFLSRGSTGDGQCQNLGGATTCASTPVSGLIVNDDVYVSATWAWYGTGVGRDEAQCSIKRGSGVLDSVRFGQLGNEHSLNDSKAMGSLIGLDQTAPANSATYSLVCSEVNGAVEIISADIVAFRLSG